MAETGYSMVSVPKESNNQGMPGGKRNVVVLFDFDKVKTYTRDGKDVKITALALNTGVKSIGIFVDESTINAGDEVEGDAYARGFIHHVNFDHPGNDLANAEFKANNVNANLGAIVIDCDPSVTTAKVYGTPCSPLKMNQGQEQDTRELRNNHYELRNIVRTSPVGIIDKTSIPATDNADINALLGIGGSQSSDL